MNIIWYGLSCFKILDQDRDHEVSLVTDPYQPEGGKKLPRNLTSDIVAMSHDHPRHNNVAAVGGQPFLIDGPGEFEVKDLFVQGVRTYHDLVEGKEKGVNTIYYVNVNGFHLLFLGDLKHPLEEKQMEHFHDIDVLFVPVGGSEVLNAKQAADVVGQIEPRLIVPMHYRTAGFAPKSDGVEAFLKVMGSGKVEPVPKLKLSDKELPQEEMRVVILEPQ